MSEKQSSICMICGGIQSWHGGEMPIANSISRKKFYPCPGHPASATKHDGTLSGRIPYQVCCVIGKKTQSAGVRIGHKETTNDEIWLSPAQTLSLLDWLQQEKETLTRLAKEQADE